MTRDTVQRMKPALERQLSGVERFQRDIIGIEVPSMPTMLPKHRQEARAEHLDEELAEFRAAETVDAAADAALDLVYLGHGALVEMGVIPGVAFDEVHRANMAKVRGSRSKRPRSAGFDAVKPVDWKGPDWDLILRLSLSEVEGLRKTADSCWAQAEGLAADNEALGARLDAVGAELLEARRLLGRQADLACEQALSDGQPDHPFMNRSPQLDFYRAGMEAADRSGPTDGQDADRPAVDPSTGFMKFDGGKACRPELIPAPVIQALGELYAYGARKYAAENWRKGTNYQRYIGGADRHKLAWQMGQDIDVGETVNGEWRPGSGSHHLVNAAWNLLTVYMMQIMGVGEDDRPDRAVHPQATEGLSTRIGGYRPKDPEAMRRLLDDMRCGRMI